MKSVLAALFRAAPLPLIRLGLWAANAKFNVGVAGVFFNQAGEVLVLRHVFRRRWPWGLPAGYLLAGETPEAGMLRELKEETGLDGAIERLLHVHVVHDRHLEVVMCGSVDVELAVRLSGEITEAAFCRPDALPAEMQPSHVRWIGDVARARSAIPIAPSGPRSPVPAQRRDA